MNKSSLFSNIENTLAIYEFGAYRRPNWYDSHLCPTGFLRVELQPEDDRITLYRFNRGEVLEWKVDLHAAMPLAVITATLDAAMMDVGIEVELPS